MKKYEEVVNFMQSDDSSTGKQPLPPPPVAVEKK
jgi:hypothetical protein